MADYTDQDGNAFVESVADPDGPVRAWQYNALLQTAKLLRSSKCASLAGLHTLAQLPFGVSQDGGALFHAWQRLPAGAETCLVDPFEYGEAIAPGFRRHGLRGRFLAIEYWRVVCAAGASGRYGPAGAKYDDLFESTAHAMFYTGGGGSAHELDIPWDDVGATMCFYLSEGRLMGRLTYPPEAQPDTAVVLFLRVDCSPLFAWTDLSAPAV